jgi:hypothetical protein
MQQQIRRRYTVKTINAKRQGGFLAFALGFGLIALGAAAGLTIDAATSEDESKAAQEQQVQLVASPADGTSTTR